MPIRFLDEEPTDNRVVNKIRFLDEQPEVATNNEQVEKPGLFEKLKERGSGIYNAVHGDELYGVKNPGLEARALKAAGTLGGAIGDVVSAPVGMAASLIPSGIKQGIGDAGKALASKVGNFELPLYNKQGVREPTKLKDAFSDLPEIYKRSPMPEGSKDVLGDILNTGEVVGAGVGLAKGLTKGVVKNISGEAAETALKNKVKAGMNKGVKPTVIGKPSLKKLESFYEKSTDAVKTIAKNRTAINLVDDVGEAIPMPRNSIEFAQAIDKTKKLIYKKYHDKALAAGDAGANFDVRPIINDIDKFVSGKDFKKRPPKAREYALKLKDELSELAGESPEVIEERIADLNKSLGPYYMGRDKSAEAAIDAAIAIRMRNQLDKQITELAGEGYQQLKNEYGALLNIENEVAKRALVNARKQNKSLLDYTDIFSGGDIAAGVLTMNPALVAKGAAQRGIKEVFKALNDPDRAIKQMFEYAYKNVDEVVEQAPAPSYMKDLTRTIEYPESPAFARKGVKVDEQIGAGMDALNREAAIKQEVIDFLNNKAQAERYASEIITDRKNIASATKEQDIVAGLKSKQKFKAGDIEKLREAERAPQVIDAQLQNELFDSMAKTEEGRNQLINAIRMLRPTMQALTPEQEYIQTMKNWQAGKVRWP